MARTVQIHLLDDIDGSAADETVTFLLDGTAFEIDLSAKNAVQFRNAVAPYIAAGRRTVAAGIVTGGRARRAAPALSGRQQNREIREWAHASGIELNRRGRIPAHVIERFDKESNR